MLKCAICLLLLPVIVSAQLIDDDVMPFGGYSSHHANTSVFFSDSCLGVMHNELGINQFTTGFNDYYAGLFADSGIFAYPFGVWNDPTWTWEPQQQYSHSTYYICHPDSCDFYNICCATTNGDIGGPDNEYWYYSGEGLMLSNWWLKFENKNGILHPTDKLQYFPYLKIGRDDTQLDPETVIGYFRADRVIGGDPTQYQLRFIDTLYAADIPIVPDDTLISLIDESSSLNYFHIRDDNMDSSHFAYFSFYAEGNCTVYIDYFKVHCQFGGDLIDPPHLYDDDISVSVARAGYKDKILGWMLKDTPRPEHIRPNNYIDDLIQQAMIDSSWSLPVRGYPWYSSTYKKDFRDFTRLAEPEVFWAYMYPIDSLTSFTGWDLNGNKIQSNFKKFISEPCDSIRTMIDEFDSLDSWMFTPQYWWCLRDSLCTNWEQRRKPTESELKCETFLGLCYKPKGIMFWKYDSSPNGENGFQGLVDINGNHRPELYDVVKNDINPYIKAIDATYMPLEWQRAYAYHNGTPDHDDYDPPSGAYVSSISSFTHPDSVSSNPDSGWFHVGEYEDTLNAKYIMLVNRACSQGESNPAPAPSVTATVKFDPTNLGLGNYVYIIDIADSVDYVDYDSVLFYPDTTYSAILPDSTIPFTTVLGPGEGRLYKIVQASQLNLIDTISTNYTYQGKIRVTGDAIVPADSSMKILGPARLILSGWSKATS